jgi:hypothetical protein|tara:strand:+ start:466 stop:645 length:180 start_codon:yes stop_codon:yes gene_type:complete
MTQAQLITLGYKYERATGARAQALRQCFNTALKQTQTPAVRELYIYSFNQGRHEARTTR